MIKKFSGFIGNRSVFISVLYFIVSLQNIVGVRINRLHVPKVTRLGSPVVLDCEYTLENSLDEGPVVKWYFNGSLLYQWISNKKPQESGIFRGRLNLNYSASTDINHAHRALHIIKPGPDLSGDYTCSVSTLENEDKKTKRMLVYVPEKNFELHQKFLPNRTMEVFCSAEGVFPEPVMSIFRGNRSVNVSIVTIEERDGLFDIKARARVPALLDPEEFSCELDIPQANYTARKDAIYYPAMLSVAPALWNLLSTTILSGCVLLL